MRGHEDFIPAEGRSVVYAYPTDRARHAECAAAGVEYDGGYCYRPAQIVRVWNEIGPKTCNLVVFVDGSNDVDKEPLAAGNNCVFWKTSVMLGTGAYQYLPRKPEAAAA